jgi:hypothetical protein
MKIHKINATGLFGGVRGDLTFGFERDPDVGDARFVRERERGFKTGLLVANESKFPPFSIPVLSPSPPPVAPVNDIGKRGPPGRQVNPS